MDASGYARGNFLGAEDIKKLGTTVRVTGEAIVNEDTPFGREILEIPVELSDGSERTYGANKTSAKALVDAWGGETRGWVGKTIRFDVQRQNVRGQMKDVLFALPGEATTKVTEIGVTGLPVGKK